ncbi:hypothetical protein J6590_083076 [Homalodisca vitripennis]|nr:hypothetical protein J6590_083076 [Homalodisca vitripennis]
MNQLDLWVQCELLIAAMTSDFPESCQYIHRRFSLLQHLNCDTAEDLHCTFWEISR